MPAPTEAPLRLGAVAEWMEATATSIPVLPELAIRVIGLAADPDATVFHLSRIISKDQVLTARLLSLANSAYGASASEVTTVADAIMRVGANGVRNLAVTVCFASRKHDRNIYGSQGPALVDHGVGTAYLARLIAEAADLDTEQAFLCGLLHDIGKLVLLKWYHDQLRRSPAPIPPDQVGEIVRQWHPTVAGLAFRRWKLPTELDEPVMCHHDYSQAVQNRELTATVYLANRLSHRYGFGCDPDGFDPVTDPASAELGLTEPWLKELDERAPGLFSIARSMLS